MIGKQPSPFSAPENCWQTQPRERSSKFIGGILIEHPANALRRYEQASQNPVARQAGRPSAGRRETASHSHSPRRADSRLGSPPRTPDTSTANRPSSFSLHGRSRIGTRPAFRREWDGEGKAESLPWRGPAGIARHTGATIAALGTKGQSPWLFPLEQGWRRSASLSRNAAQEPHPCNGAMPPDALRAGLWAGGRPASREARVPAG